MFDQIGGLGRVGQDRGGEGEPTGDQPDGLSSIGLTT
jgi:hypothetical protein